MKRLIPGMALLFIAPLLGELVSGHMNLVTFFNPVTFAVMALPYGCGALLCRELARRWGKGWLSLLLLSMAYGVYEEGIVSRAFFDPYWLELGALETYDTYAGINWTYSLSLVHFHVTISILSSIMLSELIFPRRRRESWLSNGQLALCGLVLALWAPVLAILAQADTPLYLPPLGLYALAGLEVVGLVVAARLAPAQPFPPTGRQASPPHWLLLLGALNVTIIFVTVYMLPELWRPFPLFGRVAFLLIFNMLSFWLFLRWSGNALAWDDRHRLALVMGLLAFFFLFGLLSDLESFEGRSLVSLMTGVALWRLWRDVNSRVRAGAQAS